MILAKVFNSIYRNRGGIILIDYYGNQYICGSPDKNKPIKLKLLNKKLHWLLVINPELAFPEAYMKGEIEIENGTLKDFLMLSIENLGREEVTKFGFLMKKISRMWRFFTNYNLPGKSKRNVQHHYDVGGEKGEKLYDIFLDKKHRQYSCAYWKNNTKTLEEAQQNKLDHIIKKLDLKENDKVLDIGCGWGGLSFEIAKQKKSHVTGISLSENQINYCKEKAKKNGFDNQVDFQLIDYRELQGQFDKIVSVGMFEHVGKKFYKSFFDSVNRLLKPDGNFLLHTISTIEKPGPGNEFIGRYIFPGGVVPSFSELIKPIENAKLIVSDCETLIRHYDKTLECWLDRFQEKAEIVKNLYDEKFYRMWEFYLASCSAAFRFRDLCVVQLSIVKNFKSAPQPRDYIYS